MDSITQATLGAAVGHAILGEKMGNKAILVGAVAGTIPDLDVLSRLFLEHQIYGLVYHRGITHSIAFTLIAAPIFGWLHHQFYHKKWHHKKGIQVGLAAFWGILYALFLFGLGFLAYSSEHLLAYSVLGLGMLGVMPLYQTLDKSIKHRLDVNYDISWVQWSFMYGMAFLTHWLIDACTAYGTQIFEPFSRYRVAFNNISIVDPLYTVPMILGLAGALLASRYKRQRFWNYLGIGVATLYMASTFYSKSIVNQIVQNSLEEQGISYQEYITYPTIFNTILWQTTVESEDAYYYGTYSLFDKEPKVKFTKLPKNHEMIAQHQDEEYLGILLWFANGYYNVIEHSDGRLAFNNLRFGMMGLPDDSEIPLEDRYIFRFFLVEKDGRYEVEEDVDFDRVPIADIAPILWERIKGV